MRRYTGADQGVLARQKANRDEMRPRLLGAARSFLTDKGRLQTTLDAFA